jgi:hypothetical protein
LPFVFHQQIYALQADSKRDKIYDSFPDISAGKAEIFYLKLFRVKKSFFNQ